MTPFIKICCISSQAEAKLAVAAGVQALGLVSAMPSGPGVIADNTIASIAAATPPPVMPFLLSSRQGVSSLIEQVQALGISTLQLVDELVDGSYADLREALPYLRLVQVIHVTGPESVAQAERVCPAVDALLLDSGQPTAAQKELGGTGRVHDWRISREIRDRVRKPVFLAGGLKPENVAEAIRQVHPFGVDVCSGVRTGGRLDPDKLRRFVAAVRSSSPAELAS
jgi:phosphoribosylanthranilate isomerase